MESTSYVLSFRMVLFLPCDHGPDFLHHLMSEFNQSINAWRKNDNNITKCRKYYARKVGCSAGSVYRGKIIAYLSFSSCSLIVW